MLARVLENISDAAVHLVLWGTPIFFWPGLVDGFELVKQTWFIVWILVAVLAWLVHGILMRELKIHGVFFVGGSVFFLLYALIVSFSEDRFLSLVGDAGQMAFSLLTMGACLVFVQLVSQRARIGQVGYVYALSFLGAGGLASAYALLQLFGWYVVPAASTHAAAFTSIGSIHSLAMYLTVPLGVALVLGMYYRPGAVHLAAHSRQRKIFAGVIIGLALGLMLAGESAANFSLAWSVICVEAAGVWLLDEYRRGWMRRMAWTRLLTAGVFVYAFMQLIVSHASWSPAARGFLALPLILLSLPANLVTGALVCALVALAWKDVRAKGSGWRWLPGAVLVLGFWFLSGGSNGLRLALPAEVVPSARASWDIARSVLQHAPAFGSGPGTWQYDYTQYHTPLVNRSPFWETRFEHASSGVLTLVPTIGLVGMGAVLLCVVGGLVMLVLRLPRLRAQVAWPLGVAGFAGWIGALMVTALYPVNMTAMLAWWFVLGLAGGSVWPVFTPRLSSLRSRYLLAATSVAAGIFGVCLIWLLGQRVLAERAFAQALQAYGSERPLSEVVPVMERAVGLNPWYDAYARNLAQGEVLQAVQLSAPGTADGSGAALNLFASAKRLSEQTVAMTPANAANWASAGLVYEAQERVQAMPADSVSAALPFYQQAHALDPWNPVFSTEIGKIFFQQGERAFRLATAPEFRTGGPAVTNAQHAWQKSFDWLTQALQAKPDYLPARYELAVVLERLQRLPEAITQLEQVLRTNNQDKSLAFELALLYEQNRQFSQATGLMEQVVRADPGQLNARWYLSAMYEAQGSLDEAIQQTQAMAAVLPHNRAIQARLLNLQQARQAHRPPQAPVLPDPLDENRTRL